LKEYVKISKRRYKMISFAKSLDENETAMMAKYLSTMKKTIPKERYEHDSFDNTGDGSS